MWSQRGLVDDVVAAKEDGADVREVSLEVNEVLSLGKRMDDSALIACFQTVDRMVHEAGNDVWVSSIRTQGLWIETG